MVLKLFDSKKDRDKTADDVLVAVLAGIEVEAMLMHGLPTRLTCIRGAREMGIQGRGRSPSINVVVSFGTQQYVQAAVAGTVRAGLGRTGR